MPARYARFYFCAVSDTGDWPWIFVYAGQGRATAYPCPAPHMVGATTTSRNYCGNLHYNLSGLAQIGPASHRSQPASGHCR